MPPEPLPYQSLAAALQHERRTHEEVARAVGVSRSYVCKLARGHRRPSGRLAVQLSRLLHIDLAALLVQGNDASPR